MPRWNQVRVAVGFDQSLSDSDNIEAFIPNIGSPKQVRIRLAGLVYLFVNSRPQFSRGQARVNPNTGTTYVGFEQVRYTSPMVHIDTFAWLEATYEGQVTANLRTNSTAYAEYNAELTFTSEPTQRFEWVSVTWIFTLIEALP